MKTNIFPPPIYRLDKIDLYIKAKLDDYLRESKKISKGSFDKNVFIKMFLENEIEQSKILLNEVGQVNRTSDKNPYSMSFDRSGYGYPKDHESIHLEKEFFKFYIIKIEELLERLSIYKNGQKPKMEKPIELLKNENDKVFKNDAGFTIFTKMFEIYKDDKNALANFSFLFYAMEKDFLVCTQTEFREFLRDEKYNIEIDKIDSRQSGKTNKTKLYNSIKERYQSNTIKAQ